MLGSEGPMRALIFVSIFACLAGCSSTERLGAASACFAAAGDDEEAPDPFERVESRAGLRLVAAGEEATAPAAFVDCARGQSLQAELVDDTGEHIWLALDARYGGDSILPAALLSAVSDAILDFHAVHGFSPSTSLVLSQEGRPIVGLQSTAPLEGDLGPLQVEDGGASALATPATCSSVTAKALRFIDDNGGKAAANGEEVELIVDGVEYSGMNLFSAEYGESSCEDAPSSQTLVTWAAWDNSF